LTNLDNTVQAVRTTVTDLPKTFDVKLETVQQDLRSNLMTTVNSLVNTFYTDLSKHHVETTECFKTYATTMASISTDVINLNKHLTALKDTTSSKIDVERLVVAKWQDKLDPHIQSHYEFKQATTIKLETLDKTS
jgi:protein-arginine kinase activator protein McsA